MQILTIPCIWPCRGQRSRLCLADKVKVYIVLDVHVKGFVRQLNARTAVLQDPTIHIISDHNSMKKQGMQQLLKLKSIWRSQGE